MLWACAFAMIYATLPGILTHAQASESGYRVLSVEGQWHQSGSGSLLRAGATLLPGAHVFAERASESDFVTLVSIEDATLRKIECSGGHLVTCQRATSVDIARENRISLSKQIKPYIAMMSIMLGESSPESRRRSETQLARGSEGNCTESEDILPDNFEVQNLLSRELPELPDGEYKLESSHPAVAASVQTVSTFLRDGKLTGLPTFGVGSYRVRIFSDKDILLGEMALMFPPQGQRQRYFDLLEQTRAKLIESRWVSI